MLERAAIQTNIQNATNIAMDYAKEQKAAKNTLKASQAQIEAAAALFPDQADYLGKIANELKNEDTPLSERAAMASQVADIINMGVGQKRYETELGFKRQDQENQNRESSMRQWAYGQQVTEAQDEATAKDSAKKIKGAIGPAFLDSSLKSLEKYDPKMAESIREASRNFTPEEKYKAGASATGFIPKEERKKAPVTIEVSENGGKQLRQWDDDLEEFIPIQTNISTGAGVKATTYGHPSDPYLDSNSAKGIGAFGKLEPNDVALSPDMEKSVRAKGINPGDQLSVTMANGDIVKGRWMDRTAQDSDVSSGKIKGVSSPLRGRVDFYTPGGVNPYDGMGVSAISKIGSDATVQTAQNPVGFTPNDASMSPTEKIAVQKYADEKGDQVAKRAADSAKSQEFINVLTKLENHPGFDSVFGYSIPFHKNIPGTDAAGAYALFQQIEGKGFLESIQAMKGMGALSNAEGEKVSSAYLGITTNMAEKEVKKRITELKTDIVRGIERQRTGNLVNPDGTPMAAAATAPPVDPITAASMKLQGLIPR
jgi:hypothetical protein